MSLIRFSSTMALAMRGPQLPANAQSLPIGSQKIQSSELIRQNEAANRSPKEDSQAGPERSSPRHPPRAATKAGTHQPLREQGRALAVVADHFRRSPRRPRKQNRWPLSGSRRNTSCISNDSFAKPFLTSVWPVASPTRTRSEFASTRSEPGAGPPHRRHCRRSRELLGSARSRSKM
jgi:hypothetical protein